MKSYHIIYIFILVSLLSSCEKDANVKLPAIEPKLVVSCLIYPQNPLTQVALSKSIPIYNSNETYSYKAVTGATVIISDGSSSWILPFDTAHQTYALDSVQLKIKANTSYTLSVSTADGKSVEASTTVPSQNTTLTYTTSFDTQSNHYKFRGTWQDPESGGDYYRLEVGRDQNSSTWYYADAVDLTDEDNSGGRISTTLELTYYSSGDTTYASLLSASSEFYNFFSRVKNRGFSVDGGLLTEPMPMYTNIKNGLGIFAGFNRYKVKVNI